MTKKRKIGLLGGSFNPAHEGHIYISIETQKRLRLDKIWWIVSTANPLKNKKELAPFPERLAYSKYLVQHSQASKIIEISDFEHQKELRYSDDLINSLIKHYPRIKFIWIIGSDNLTHFHKWKNWRNILKNIPIAVISRRPFIHKAIRSKAAIYTKTKQQISSKLLTDNNRPANYYATSKNTPTILPSITYIFIRPCEQSSTKLRKKLGKKAFLRNNIS